MVVLNTAVENCIAQFTYHHSKKIIRLLFYFALQYNK
jgi:hypothetical protein